MIAPTAWPGAVPELAPGDVHVWSVAAGSAELALPEVLAAHAGVDPGDIRVDRAEGGKPFLAAPPGDLHFNLSHSGELAFIAVARGREVGVDVEAIRPLEHARRIAERVFIEEADFFRNWARREALLKATGAGVLGPVPADGWEVVDVDAGPGYAAALAIRAPAGDARRSR
jgi:4'-phosphopantetheinyl transferase